MISLGRIARGCATDALRCRRLAMPIASRRLARLERTLSSSPAISTAGQVFASAADCFGQAYGSVSADGSNTVQLFCSTAGKYHVLFMADRNDQVAQDEFAEFGVEYDARRGI